MQAVAAGESHPNLALQQCRRAPPGDFPAPIFDVVLKAIGITASIVGTRADLQEALDFAGEGLVKATVQADRLDDINAIFARMRGGQIEGRVVLQF